MEIIKLEEVDSTNRYAKTNIDLLDDKTIITTKKQTSGRGRLNRLWIDLGENNLFMSIILKPSVQYNENYTNLTQYLSVILCKVLENYNLKPSIKWPNDVLVNGKKIAGILSESVIQGSSIKGIVLGIGVNLNASLKDVQSIPDKLVTALNLELGNKVNLDKFQNELLEAFFENYDKFINEGFSFIKEDYTTRNCFLNKELKVQVLDKEENGLAEKITDRGELVLLKDNNKEIVLTIGDII